jgi:hypothetical protein
LRNKERRKEGRREKERKKERKNERNPLHNEGIERKQNKNKNGLPILMIYLIPCNEVTCIE